LLYEYQLYGGEEQKKIRTGNLTESDTYKVQFKHPGDLYRSQSLQYSAHRRSISRFDIRTGTLFTHYEVRQLEDYNHHGCWEYIHS
jgi:hypothetical protein